MNKITFGGFCLALVILVSGCSRKKDSFINRNWHALTAEYNTLYNGNLALDQGLEQLTNSYHDNFWEILPIERMQVSEEIVLPGTVKNEFFQIAEVKATKAIQKHSMPIQGKEKNPQIDEAYLLLGKARYYDQRFVPALEAFNYILYKYPASDNIDHARIWREKTNIRLQNNQLAIKNLKKILEDESLEEDDRADASAMLAQAYVNIDALDSAVVPVKKAAALTDNNDEQGRYSYIAAQLYNYLGKRDSANLAFDRVIELNRKIPREYLINAYLGKARNFNFLENDPSALYSQLTELEENRENRPYLDKIYFQMAEYYNHIDSTDLATTYYNKSLQASTNDAFLQSVNYETIGNIYFDNAEYRLAGAYYDSTLTKIPPYTRDYFFIERKRDNLQEVIVYEEIAEKNDSILNLVKMTGEERINYFTSYTEGLKEAAMKEAKAGNIAEVPQPGPDFRGPGLPPALGSTSNSSSFYFYNPVRIANGMQEFLQIWGSRELQDNWRLNPGNVTPGMPDELDDVTSLIISNNPLFDPQMYLEKIPEDPVLIDSLITQRNDAYFRLGLIYKEKFGENSLAEEKLKPLLDFTSEERIIIPAIYHLYQIKIAEGNPSEAENYKRMLLNNYPDSRYAENILNPGMDIEQKDVAEENYEELYKIFEKGDYVKTLELSRQYSAQIGNEEVLPKIALLEAMALGRLEGLEAYKSALQAVIINYPRTPSGIRAQDLYNTLIPQLEKVKFEPVGGAKKVKLLYGFKTEEKEEAGAFQNKIDSALVDLGYSNLSTSVDLYTGDRIFVVVHHLENTERALGFAELLSINEDYAIEKEPIVISSENYRVVQLHKNLDSYQEMNKSLKP